MSTDSPQTEHNNEVIRQILNIPIFGSTGVAAMNYSLDRMDRWSRRLGHPERTIPTIHVAGTNGKGTTCRMLASIYEAAGYRTALYTSPHLIDLRERIRYHLQPIPIDAVEMFWHEYQTTLKTDPPTFFELLTLLAFWYFARQQADIAIIETGLGGRLDATNIVTPKCTVITSIGMDHKEILGETLEKIASEKAGIMKQSIPLILGVIPPQARAVIMERADRLQVPVSEVFPSTRKKRTLPHALRPPTDRINQDLAKITVQTLQEQFPVSDEALRYGLSHWHEQIRPHANFEPLAGPATSATSHTSWYFSGAHNPQAWEDLTAHLLTLAPAHEWTVVLSLMADKITPEMHALFAPFRNLYLYSMNSERAATPDLLQKILPWGTIITSPSEIPAFCAEKERSGLVIFAGSLYFYSTVDRWVQTIQTTVSRG